MQGLDRRVFVQRSGALLGGAVMAGISGTALWGCGEKAAWTREGEGRAVTFTAVPGATYTDAAGNPVPEAQYASRLDTLEGKSIALVSNGQWEASRTFPMISKYLEDTYNCTIIGTDNFPTGNGPIAGEDSGIPQTALSLGVDAAIIGNAACGHCATSCGRCAAWLELAGIPTTLVVRDQFEERVIAAFGTVGLSAAIPVTYLFDGWMFQEGSDLAPLSAHMEDFLRALLA